jgi:hypothetical protein
MEVSVATNPDRIVCVAFSDAVSSALPVWPTLVVVVLRAFESKMDLGPTGSTLVLLPT